MDVIDENIKYANTLSGDFYSSHAEFKNSKENIFAKSWQLVGDNSHLSKPNFKKPFVFLDEFISEPLLVVNNNNQSFKCYSNVCTHRGNILIDKPCKAKEISCKYHGRRFNCSGELIFIPEFKEVKNFPLKQDNLTEIPLNRWRQFLFCSLNPKINFNSLIQDMEKRIGWMPIEKFQFDSANSKDYFVNANWALYCDNYLEGFHIPFVHKELNKVINYEDYKTEIFSFSNLQLAESDSEQTCFDLPKNSEDFGKNIAAYYFWIFPNMMFNFYPWGLSVNVVKPLKPNLTKVEFRTYVWDESKRDSGAGSILDKVEKEDEEIVENVQKGVNSRYYKSGRFSPKMEKGVHHFHKLISNFIST